ncbi:LOW QUALITY PROTEIN: hypothetical protein, conserved [Eimeria necatrix]|uniref:Uncharacterized protein n=1 Tax=Eimeria necatrix TaxID=51315 RepID=U6MNT6_9EIME|nr:LOW QUALITY PROTEIN: hypothetical protein, conserved [Eimeria necatrix]CDJ65671.1 hypothetical protein, conserved [Eimeria necatrix]
MEIVCRAAAAAALPTKSSPEVIFQQYTQCMRPFSQFLLSDWEFHRHKCTYWWCPLGLHYFTATLTTACLTINHSSQQRKWADFQHLTGSQPPDSASERMVGTERLVVRRFVDLELGAYLPPIYIPKVTRQGLPSGRPTLLRRDPLAASSIVSCLTRISAPVPASNA